MSDAMNSEAMDWDGTPNATFVWDDVTTFTGFDGRFDTIIDSTLFHSLPVESRDGYQQSVLRAAAYCILVFAKGAFPAESEKTPDEVGEAELRDAVGRYWDIDEVRPAFIDANMPSGPDAPFPLVPHDHDDARRSKMPALLPTAHEPG